MKLKNLFLVFTAVVALASCKSQYEILLNSNDIDMKYKAALDYYDQGKYTKSAALFESLSVMADGMPKHDTIMYYWGLSNYMFKDYYTAETNFDKFIESYPRSPFTSDARYLAPSYMFALFAVSVIVCAILEMLCKGVFTRLREKS